MLNFLQSAGEGGKNRYHPHLNPPPSEAVSQFVIPAKPRETGREPGSRSTRDDAISLDSGSRYAARRSSGMTGFIHYDTASQGGGEGLVVERDAPCWSAGRLHSIELTVSIE